MKNFDTYYRKLICEVTLEQAKERFGSKKWIQEYGDDAITKGLRFDPDANFLVSIIPFDIRDSEKGNALMWLITQALKPEWSVYRLKQINQYSINIRNTLETFYTIKNVKPEFLQKRALEMIDNVEELSDIVEDANVKFRKYTTLRAHQSTNIDIEQFKVYEDSMWEVYIPTTKGAAVVLGAGTDWCTAAPGLDYYEHYSSRSPLIIFVSKSDSTEKYQLWYHESITDSQFMDVRDESIFDGSILNSMHFLASNINPNIHSNKRFIILNQIVKNNLFDKLPNDAKHIVNVFDLQINENQVILKLVYNPDITSSDNTTVYYNSNWEMYNGNDNPAIIALDGLYESNKGVWIYANTPNQISRTGGPAVIIKHSQYIRERWYNDGKLHRLDGPAKVTINKSNGVIIHKDYYVDDMLCNPGPEYDEAVRLYKFYGNEAANEL